MINKTAMTNRRLPKATTRWKIHKMRRCQTVTEQVWTKEEEMVTV
jgi:hypothetical protein